MANLIASLLVGLAAAYLVSTLLTWRRVHNTAKTTNFAVFLTPVYYFDLWWLVASPFLLPWLNKLPRKWTRPWLQMSTRFSSWKSGYKPFEEVGTDTFILSTPRGNLLWTSDHVVISQLSKMHPQSQTATKILWFLNIYGPSIGTVEGEEWKRHRRVVMSAFEPSTNAMVWSQSIHQAQGLLQRWSDEGNEVNVAKEWMKRLALHVIASVFFSQNLTWTKDTQTKDHIPFGHQLSFEEAQFGVIESLQTILLVPKMLRSLLPFESVRKANLAFTEWTMYLEEMRDDALKNLQEINNRKIRSLVESFVMASKTGDNPLPEASILGNLFFTMIAGHETAGNTMAFALDVLALYPEYQSKIQEDLDGALAVRPLEDWTVEREYQALQKGWLGAVLKETLRVYGILQFVMRQVVAPIHVIDSKGNPHTIPEDTLCFMNFAGAFRNPNLFPPRDDIPEARQKELHYSPAALDFDPSRWLEGGSATVLDVGAEAGLDGSAAPRHFPFGQGPHICPGRIFAQVEMVATLATILATRNVELVVSGETLTSCDGNEMAARTKTRDDAFRRLIDDVKANLTLYLSEELPLRFVKRL